MSIKKKFALGVSSLVVGAALVGGGTLAYFNSTATNADNTFAAGTIELTGVTTTKYFDLGNMQPGDTFDSGVATLVNAGTLDGDLDVTVTSTPTGGADGSDLRTQLIIEELIVNGANVASTYAGTDSVLTLDELTAIDLGTLAASNATDNTDQVTLQIKGKFNETNAAQNQYQGDSVDVDLAFELKQN